MAGPGPPILAPGSPSRVQFVISNREVSAGGKEGGANIGCHSAHT